MKRRIIIGDVHGNYQGVENLLHINNYNPNDDILIFVGDYNDHEKNLGFSTKNTIDLLLELKKASESVFFVLGNHDLWFREWLDSGGIPHPMWAKQGARETFASYGIHQLREAESQIEKIPESHRHFYKNEIQDYYIDDVMVVIHGGFTNAGQMVSISKEEKLDYEQIYQVIWDRRFLFTKLQEEKFMFEKYFGDRYLITGHTPYGPYQSEINQKWVLIDGGSKTGKPQAGVVITDTSCYFISEES